jgi:glutaredoxin 3
MKEVIVYTQTVCPYCTNAKTLLKNKGIAYKEINLDERPDAEWEALQKQTGLRTLPQIFIADECVGGFNDLAALDKAGQLMTKVNG